MKTSSEYRALARETLEGRWGEMAGFTLVVLLIVMAVALVFAVPFSVVGTLNNMPWLSSTGSGLSTLVNILFAVPLEYALYIYFLKLIRREEMMEGNVKTLFQEFQNNWSTFVVAGVLMALVVLLIMIPTLFIGAIIFSLAYGMVPYIIYDNPGIAPREALRMSRMMMRGHKAELFLLQLSFIGWALLCILCPIGLLWLCPYMYAATAHFYEDVKAEYAIREEQQTA